MELFSKPLVAIKSAALDYIHKYVTSLKEEIKTSEYTLFTNPGFGTVVATPLDKSWLDASTRFITELDTDTVCKIADELKTLSHES